MIEFNEIKAPYEGLLYEESKYIVYNFCTLCSLLKNKKLNFQHIFALILTEANYREFLKELLNEDSDLEVYRTLLLIEPSIASSKYISKLGKSVGQKNYDGYTERDL